MVEVSAIPYAFWLEMRFSWTAWNSSRPLRPGGLHVKRNNKVAFSEALRYFSESVCQPGLVQLPLRSTKISVTRPDVCERLPATSVSYTY
jgi:hypothetical protein